jgi:O-antigen/teichoic acid export membrane protein
MFVAIANALSPAEYGRFGFGFSLSITLATIAGLGLGTAVLRYLPQYEAQKQPDLAVGFVRWATTTTVAVPLALGLAVALITFALHASGHIERPAYLYATAALVPITAIGEFFANLLRAEGFTFASMAPRDIFWRAAVALWALVLVVTGLQSSGAGMLSMAGALLLAIVVIQLAYARARITPLLSQGPGRQERRQWMATIAPMWGVATLYALVQQSSSLVCSCRRMWPAPISRRFARQHFSVSC